MDLTWLLLVMIWLSSVGYNKTFQWSHRTLHGHSGTFMVGFMQDQIIASLTRFGGPMDVNCYCLLSQFTIFLMCLMT